MDKHGTTVDFLLTARRDADAALRFLWRAVDHNGLPEKVTIDCSGANAAGIAAYGSESPVVIEVRRQKYLNDIVEQDDRFVKQKMRATLGWQTFYTAKTTIAGIELVHMFKKGQVRPRIGGTDAGQFFALAA